VHGTATEVEGAGEAGVVGDTLPGGVGATEGLGAVGAGEGGALAGDKLELAGVGGAAIGGAVVGPAIAIRMSSTLEEPTALE
jgi:hypothetical protein